MVLSPVALFGAILDLQRRIHIAESGPMPLGARRLGAGASRDFQFAGPQISLGLRCMVVAWIGVGFAMQAMQAE